jgi:hypothetical protein
MDELKESRMQTKGPRSREEAIRIAAVKLLGEAQGGSYTLFSQVADEVADEMGCEFIDLDMDSVRVTIEWDRVTTQTEREVI